MCSSGFSLTDMGVANFAPAARLAGAFPFLLCYFRPMPDFLYRCPKPENVRDGPPMRWPTRTTPISRSVRRLHPEYLVNLKTRKVLGERKE